MSIKSGYSFKSTDWDSTGENVIKIKDIQSNSISLTSMSHVSNTESLKKASRFKVNGQEVIIALTGATVGKIGSIPNGVSAYINQRVGLTIPANDIENIVIFAILSQEEIINKIISLADGSAQANLSTNVLDNLTLTIDKDKCIIFQNLYASMYALYCDNLASINSLKNLRDTLISELI